QLLIGMSTRRYLPPSGTAGLARSFVNGNSRVPAPPPITIASVRCVVPGGSAGNGNALSADALFSWGSSRFCTSIITKGPVPTATFLRSYRAGLDPRYVLISHATRLMCGIVGYVGSSEAAPILLDGLRRLEYRGYDSAGIAIVNGDHVQTRKCAGRIAAL